MEAIAISIEGLTKTYPKFKLDNVSLTLPFGKIMGVVGENGAGKTTLIKTMLGLTKNDSGKACILGESIDKCDKRIKERIGVVLDTINLSGELNAAQVNTVMKHVYKTWDEKTFFQWTEKLKLDNKKLIKEYSKGMTMKLSIAVALSHASEVLILDEATSGLDPIVRNQILDVFAEFVKDGKHAIFLSSHIVSDLEKICDNITFIHNGKVLFSKDKKELLNKYAILKCSKAEFKNYEGEGVISYTEYSDEVNALVKKEEISNGANLSKASIEDIIIYYLKGWEK